LRGSQQGGRALSVDESRAEAGPEPRLSATAHQIRGSTVLFGGRMLAMVLNMATHVLIVRLLAKGDYGAFAYALAFVALARALASLSGDHTVVSRFLALYDEQRRYGRLFGTILMEVGTILSAGLFLFVLFLGLRDVLAGTLIDSELAIDLLVILIWLAPLEALDNVYQAVFAVFSRQREIFFRKYVLRPGLRLVLVAVLLGAGSGSVTALAVGYVLTGVFGVLVYTSMAVRFFRERGLLEHFRLASVELPFREVLGFSVPLLSTELVYTSMSTISVVLLGYFSGTVEVANYRAVLPAASLNRVVSASFVILFAALAARLFAREDHEGMGRAYWQTATWVAVFSFPVFALTGPLAQDTTVFLFGERYEDAAGVLALLSLGYYFSAALGFNALTIRTYGRVRFLIGVNVTAAVVNVVLSLLLIPPYGAIGVAVANAGALCLRNVLNQAGLSRNTGVPRIESHALFVYLTIAIAAGALAVVQLAVSPPAGISFLLAALASVAVLGVNRSSLRIKDTFPEVARIPLIRRLVT
jgi:O-antigen/teichoic acid export membrane protein